MGTRGRHAAGKVSKAVAPTPRPVIIGHDAETELTELLDYIQTQSSRNANLVADEPVLSSPTRDALARSHVARPRRR